MDWSYSYRLGLVVLNHWPYDIKLSAIPNSHVADAGCEVHISCSFKGADLFMYMCFTPQSTVFCISLCQTEHCKNIKKIPWIYFKF